MWSQLVMATISYNDDRVPPKFVSGIEAGMVEVWGEEIKIGNEVKDDHNN